MLQFIAHVVGLVVLCDRFTCCQCTKLTHFLTCTGIPCRDSHCENGLVRCCLYTDCLSFFKKKVGSSLGLPSTLDILESHTSKGRETGRARATWTQPTSTRPQHQLAPPAWTRPSEARPTQAQYQLLILWLGCIWSFFLSLVCLCLEGKGPNDGGSSRAGRPGTQIFKFFPSPAPFSLSFLLYLKVFSDCRSRPLTTQSLLWGPFVRAPLRRYTH